MKLSIRGGLHIAGNRQQGVALAMALIMLTVLTILGISAMKTSTLEVRMSGNVQDSTQTFQDAESAIAAAPQAIEAPPSSTTTVRGTKVTVTTTSLGTGNPPRGLGFSLAGYQIANYMQTSVAETPSGAKSTTTQGRYQVVTK
jgi:Tfp pilus assembly protein PilX